MYDCHVTQQNVLSEFRIDRESFRIAPRYHFAAPSHAGDAGYNRFRWTMNDRLWRKHAWAAMSELDLCEELA
jgi:hypothetical protein